MDEAADSDLTTEQAERLIDQLAAIGREQHFMPILVFSGGEPLCRNDIFRLIRYAADQQVKCALATNGTLITTAIAEQIKTSGVQRVSVSLDGATSEVHNQLRKLDGSFEAAIAGVDCLRAQNIPFQFNMTVTRQNRRQLDAVFQLARRLGAVAVHLFMLVPVGCGETLSDKDMLSPEEYEDVLIQTAHKAASESLEIKVTCGPHYERVIREQKILHSSKTHKSSKGCLAGLGVLFVSHRGDVQPCGYLPVQCGNILQTPLREIWIHSEDLATMRDTKMLKGKCGICGYRDVCGGCRARAFAATGDYMTPEPTCSYSPPALTLDELDFKILKELQDEFPLAKNPYAIIANNLNIGKDELWMRISKLLKTGVIRRMGFSIDSKKIGYASTLAAVRVAADQVDQSAQVISKYPQVTHSYQREGEFNIWFTVIAENPKQVDRIVEQIRLELNVPDSDVLNLPVEKLFKLDARFA
jgi:radical SAM protein with 4Fe4S-binding SPASM domain